MLFSNGLQFFFLNMSRFTTRQNNPRNLCTLITKLHKRRELVIAVKPQAAIWNCTYHNYSTRAVSVEKQIFNSERCEERKVWVDGFHLNVREEGSGDHNVLCLPGLVGSISTDFGKIFKKMDKSKFRLISWDPPGYGKSRPPIRHHDPDFYMTDALLVAKLMENLGYEKYSILGWSNGGLSAYCLATQFPERVSNLVMWGTHAYIDDEVLVRGLRLSDLNVWSKPVLQAMLQVYDKNYLEAILANWEKSVREFYASGKSVALPERVAKVKCPSLVFHGMNDSVLVINHAQYMAQHIKKCKLIEISDAGHNLHLTHTQQFLMEVEIFLLNSSGN